MRATVAVPGPLRRLFSYTVPANLLERCRPGARVLVPFGNRRLTGYVVDLDSGPAPADQPYVLKPIEDALDQVPALDPDLLELTRWASEYYAASWGDMIRVALPGQSAPLRFEVALTVAGDEALARPATGGAKHEVGRLAAPTRTLLGSIKATAGEPGRFVGIGEVRRRGAALTAAQARSLARAGWVAVREVMLRPGPAARRETWVIPAETAGVPTGRLGPRQAKVLARLATAPQGLPAALLRRDSGAGQGTLAALARQGRLRLEARDVPRQPLALRPEIGEPQLPAALITPTPAQAEALAAIVAAAGERRFHPFLLFGVTGSGKTEVYLRAVEAVLAAGRSALYLVPEIGLTPLLARRMRDRFGAVLALMHSGLSDGERHDEWRRIRAGEVKVVLGARSAVFAPLRDLGLIVVDEEHDTSYKQEEHPRYSGRDLALVRGQRQGAVVVLGSATPSVESYHHALAGKYRLLTLASRVGGAALPVVRRVDMRREFEEVGRDSILSRRLVEAIGRRLERGEQSLILLNRRGFSTYALCRACGRPIECRACSITLTLHLRDRRLRCHYCNEQRAVPAACPACGGGPLHFGGTGTERLEETLRSLFPRARLARMDRDTVRGRGAVEDLLRRVERGAVDILAGTQMIAKGHDFPNVTLVGVLAGDALLGFPDFRAGERTFQLLSQVAGRSGRRVTAGEVIVQAFDPEHHAVRAACDHDYAGFAKDELSYRRALHYPPFSALALLVFRAPRYETALARAGRVTVALKRQKRPGLMVLGPAPAPIERLRGEWRVQVLLKAERRPPLREAMVEAAALIEKAGLRPESVTIDVDPVSTL